MNEWKTVRLGDVCEQINGVSYKPADVRDSLTNESCTLLRANNIFEDKLNYDELVFVDKKRVSNNQYMKKGDILICASSGSKHLVGKAACLLEDKELTFGAFCKVIRADSIQYDYLKHYFFSPTYRSVISHLSEGANINNIKAENLENLQIPLPPIETQKQIASTLDKCTSVIEKHKKMLQKYDTLIKSRFIEMFGENPVENGKWKVMKLNTISDVRDGTHDSPVFITEGYPLVTSQNLSPFYINQKDTNKISKSDYEKINERSLVETNDILMSMIGTVGNVSLVTDEKVTFAIKNVALLKTSKTTEYRNWVLCFLKSSNFTTWLNETLTGSTQQYVSLGEIRKISLKIPTINELNKFNLATNRIINMIIKETAELVKLQELKQLVISRISGM